MPIDLSLTSQEDPDSESVLKLQYAVKVINPSGNGGEQMKHFGAPQFGSVDEFKENLQKHCNEFVTSEHNIQFGYIIPGHGKKGKQVNISENGDLSQMYERYKTRKQIVLWVKNVSKKRSKSPADTDETPPTKVGRSRYDGHLKKMNEVEEIVDQLSKKQDKYTPEQIRAWAHMIHLKKHASYDTPPDKPFFRTKRPNSDSVTAIGFSPSKRINLRSQCIEQLDKWHSLMEKGAISSQQYEELQATILSDIKKLLILFGLTLI